MDYIPRYKLDQALAAIEPGRVLVIYGPRRSGKTTLIRHMQQALAGSECLLLNGEDIQARSDLIARSRSSTALKAWLRGYSLLIIDEAQSIERIGHILKFIVDELPALKVIASGSASFELSQQVGEPLVGRKRTLLLYPLALTEIYRQWPLSDQLENFMLYGGYPRIVTSRDAEKRADELYEMVSGYLFKDILSLEGVRDSQKLRDLLRLIAYQVGSEVSLSELGQQLGMHRTTVERYLDLFEKSFIIFRHGGFSRNLRKEVTKSAKYYFFDTGIRNAIIRDFDPISRRQDVGQLWENAMMVERLKAGDRAGMGANRYFWRTYDRQEIDLIEERGGRLHAYEFAWVKAKRPPAGFAKAYPDSFYECVTKESYWEFISNIRLLPE